MELAGAGRAILVEQPSARSFSAPSHLTPVTASSLPRVSTHHCIAALTLQHPSLHRHSHAPTPVTAPPLPFAKHICSTADALIGTALGACYLIPCALSASIRAFFAAAMTRLNLFVRAPHPRQAVGPHHPAVPAINQVAKGERRRKMENLRVCRSSGRLDEQLHH